MRFIVPQFIEREPKIIGPLTLTQFLYIGGAGFICFILYYLLPSFFLFIASCLILGALAFALAFLKISGKGLPMLLASLLKFNLSPKLYIWRKKEAMVEVYKKAGAQKEESEEEIPAESIKLTKEGQLKKVRTKIETKG